MYVNDYQCLGNHECPQVLIDELKKQGCKFDEDYCFHDFEIKDLQGIIEALEKYIFEVDERIKKRHADDSIANYSKEFEKWKQHNYTWNVKRSVDCGYMFITYNFLEYIKDDYEDDFDFDKDRTVYKIKEGHHVYMSGF